MKKTLVVATVAALVGIAGAANAADIYAPAAVGYKDVVVAPSWTGFYLGAHVGGVWANDEVSPVIADGGTFPRTNELNATGVFGGGTVGYNYQTGAFVIGIESDFGGMGLSRSRRDFGGGTEIDTINNGFYADVTGRLGYAVNNLLIYAKGGWAYYDGEAHTTTALPGFTTHNTNNGFDGWTLGGGFEYLIAPSWTLKLEYLHFDLGSLNSSITRNADGFVFPYKNDLTADSIKVGINYKWGGCCGSMPLK